MKNLNYNSDTHTFSYSLGHGYTFTYNSETHIKHIQKYNGDVVSSFAWPYDLTVTDFLNEIKSAQEYVITVVFTMDKITDCVTKITGDL